MSSWRKTEARVSPWLQMVISTFSTDRTKREGEGRRRGRYGERFSDCKSRRELSEASYPCEVTTTIRDPNDVHVYGSWCLMLYLVSDFWWTEWRRILEEECNCGSLRRSCKKFCVIKNQYLSTSEFHYLWTFKLASIWTPAFHHVWLVGWYLDMLPYSGATDHDPGLRRFFLNLISV